MGKPEFVGLTIETCSGCNDSCPTCIRNSHPEPHRLAGRLYENRLLPMDVIDDVLSQAHEMGFTGVVELQFYNEPLYDPRLLDILRHIQRLGWFPKVGFCTNGTLLTPELAWELDDLVWKISLSNLHNSMARFQEVSGWFRKTIVHRPGGSAENRKHLCVTHFSPELQLETLIAQNSGKRCIICTRRLIVNHEGTYCLCCEDLTGEFDLGNVADVSLAEMWYGKKRQSIVQSLDQPGGRKLYSYCACCPRFS